MRHLVYKVLLIGLFVGVLSFPAQAQDQGRQEIDRQRLGQTGMKFLSLSPGAREAALGDAVTAQQGSSISMFYNPAGMAYVEGVSHLSLNRIDWIGGITYNVGTAAFQPAGGRYGVVGVSLEMVDYGEVLSTIRSDADPSGYIDVGIVEPSALSAGLGYARSVTNRFAVGGHLKYVRQALGSSRISAGSTEQEAHRQSTLAVDFGVLYQTGFRSLNFAVGVQNFSRELTYAEDSFELPLTMRIGFAMDVLDLTSLRQGPHDALLSVDALRPRDYSEQVKVGLEYKFMDLLSLRGGYRYPTDAQGLSMGAGLSPEFGGLDFSFDYAYTAFGIFGNVNRIGVQMGF